MTSRSLPHKFWINWLLAVALGVAAFGLVLVIAPGAARQAFSLLIYAAPDHIDTFGTEQVRLHLPRARGDRWIDGRMGRCPFRHHKETARCRQSNGLGPYRAVSGRLVRNRHGVLGAFGVLAKRLAERRGAGAVRRALDGDARLDPMTRDFLSAED
jgi:hypothetical protein